MNYGIGGQLAQAKCEVGGLVGSVRQPNLTETLEYKRDNLKAELEKVEKAITALKANPAVEELLNLIQSVGY